MRLQSYINESALNLDLDAISPILKRDCSQYLKLIGEKKNLIYRCVNKQGNFIKVKPRTDRRPLDSPQFLHDYLDKLFLKYHGWKTRSEGVMTSSRRRSMYGTPFYFFPFDGFKYLYSAYVEDLYMEINDLGYTLFGLGANDPIKPKMLDDYEFQAGISNIVKSYSDKNFSKVYNKNIEIMWKCKNYYLLNENWIHGKEGSDQFWKELRL